MKTIETFKYTKEHEWIDANSNKKYATVGISDFAQRELGDGVFIELPNVGDSFSKNDIFGTVEAVKTVADLYIPVSGKIIGINDELESNPELINSDAYGQGWIIKIELLNNSELGDLLDSCQYQKLII